jgi:segregation and condensation protein A
MSYQVKLEVFEGPFDLLLHLIARRQLDVTEVDLAEVTADFLAHLDGVEDLDLETATRFLVVAATLIELKAARLLPAEERQEIEDLLGDARDMLYARLLEYRAFRDAARVVAHRLVRHEANLPREVPPEPWLQQLVPETPLPVDAAGLAALAAGATAPRPEPSVDLSHIRKSYITIREAASQVLTLLPAPGAPQEFSTLVRDRERGDRVVFFLALLELFKLGHVGLEQEDHRGPLQVERREGGLGLEALTEDDEDDEDDADGGDEEHGGREAGGAHPQHDVDGGIAERDEPTGSPAPAAAGAPDAREES